MDDKQIIRLFFERSEQAITELSQKYGDLCMKIARSILNDHQDAEECVNDAYLGAWNSIPPQSPDPLRAYICRIVRNRSLKKLRTNSAIKRGSQFEVSLSELEDCIPDNSMDEQLSISELSAQINAFLAALPKDDRLMFVKRYWFSESISELADAFGISDIDSENQYPSWQTHLASPRTTCLSGSAEYAGSYINTWIIRR